MSKLRSKRGRFWAFFKRIPRLRLQIVLKVPQSPPDSGIPRVENPIDKNHGSLSPPSLHTHGGDLNVTEPNTGANGGNISGPAGDTHTPFVPPPAELHVIPATSTATSILSGSRDSVVNGDELDETDPPGSPHSSFSFSRPRMQADSGGPNTTVPDNTAHDSPPPALHTESHNNNLNMTSLTSGSSPFRPEAISSLPVNTTHTSPHVESRVDDLNINGPISDTRTPSSPSPVVPHARPATSPGPNILAGAKDFVLHNPVFNVGESGIVTREMKTLSERVIEGAEYDSSLRDPPPQCHPGTRVELIERVLVWFRNGRREKALFWLSGPAGVGKSAIIQTIAESLAESKSVGATLFFSRLNNRNDPQRVFITLAYQLATRIPAYRIYITGRIALDPSLLRKGMREQFRIFITEPLGNNGMGEGPWAVLLDGLDECEGVEEQTRIITLVSEFVAEFPKAPLIWAIASRPEPRIVTTFNNKAVTPSHWSESVPIDSTQACKDVEHYLDASFKAMQEQFPHIPSNWPSQSQFLKLTHGARGLFVFARTAVRFMEDPDYADPVSRLNLIILIIDGLDIKQIDDHPFALLDALYTQILTSIPPLVWPTTKRLLGFVICARRHMGDSAVEDAAGFSYTLHGESCSALGALIIFGLELSAAYASLHKLHSVLKIPDLKEAHKSTVTFLHASFGDYLMDRVRSKEFHIDRGEVVDDIAHRLFQLYLDKSWITKWEQYLSQLPPSPGPDFYRDMKFEVKGSPRYVLTGKLRSKRGRGPLRSQQDRSDCMDALSRINPAEFYQFGFYGPLATFMIELWNTFQEELESIGWLKAVQLRYLKVKHLSENSDNIVFVSNGGYSPRLPSFDEPQRMKRDLQAYVKSHPGRPAMIYGSGPENRIAFFAGTHDEEGYFCFPYPY